MQWVFEIYSKTAFIRILKNRGMLGAILSFITRIIQEGFLEKISPKKIHFHKKNL